ncbi:SET domain-containing protein-lysine N-methyltransferase (plasmid) [Burkholderia sp. THE68]|uniref:SET domain-containing protein n=1 Tax=Burkholderia sp. THE68 TaxID=758782 RepID=UPI0013179B91|nr:SET domain-containing protein-lysine N-methyltransferase [Burkholderia sp. THE68]BBU33496.1 SET domain-containing protein-lysine N-methyltransferase [Burkholderia sp. THE68]
MRRIAVRTSRIHGRGVFALINIACGDPIIEYKGEIITIKEAQRRVERSTAEDGHTFFFNLDGGRMIDGARGGNSARWINHSCAPNCEAEQQGDRIFIHATRAIKEGTELFIDYQLDVEGRRTAALKRIYACRCGARRCRGTMLEARR